MTTEEIISAVQLKVTEQETLIKELSIKASFQRRMVMMGGILSTEIREQLNILSKTILTLANKSI